MQSSCSPSKRLVLIHFLAIQLLTKSVSSLNLTNTYLFHKCRVNGKIYQSRSKFEKNLNFSIHEISSVDGDNFKKGYIHTTFDDPPNSVTIIYSCRIDSYGPRCRSCFATAVAELRRRCTKDSVGTIWYDQCLVKINGAERSLSKNDYKNLFSMHNPNTMNGDTNSLNKNTKEFLYKLMREALRIRKDTEFPINFATGDKGLGTNKLYAMVQCMQTANEVLCKDCLESSIRELSKCCDGKRGARVLSTVCNLRYELYPFLATQKTI